MVEQKDDALLLRALPFSDSSLILHVLTKNHGRISLMARGARRAKSPFRASLMPLYHLNLRWREPRIGSMGTLIEVHRLSSLLDEQKILAGQLVLAKASILFPDGLNTGFSELWNAFHTLSERPEDSGVTAAVWEMMQASGWVGDFEHCWQCSETIQWSKTMFWQESHLCCVSCAQYQALPVSSGCRKSLHNHLTNPNIRLTDSYTKIWNEMIRSSFSAHQVKNT